jgi:hypothetical protein
LRSIRYFLADLRHWLGHHKAIGLGALGAIVALGAGAYLLLRDGDEDTVPVAAPAPEVVIQEVEVPEQTEELGFPEFATKNTTRVAGADPVADAAGVALAVHPSTGGVPGPAAVSLVDAGDWAAGVAAASLVATPIGAPILLTEDGALPELTAGALRSLAPEGSPGTDGTQVFAIGDAARPESLEMRELGGTTPAARAAHIARTRAQLAGAPDHVVVTTSEEPAIAMPAAAWAARSGDPVLFVDSSGVPEPTRKALREYERAPVYVLGPAAAIPSKVFAEIERLAPAAERVGASDPVENAIEFARFSSGSFGWNINDPGHGLVIASSSRPLDAAAAAPLSASGTWGPLLLSDEVARLSEPLRNYLLDLKPGYEADPTRAVYNHIWVIGDREALSVDLQAQIDELAELAPVSSGPGNR